MPMIQERFFSVMAISIALLLLLASTAQSFTPTTKTSFSFTTMTSTTTSLQGTHGQEDDDDMIGPFYFSGEPEIDEEIVQRLETIFMQPSSYVSLTHKSRDELPFYFSKDNSSDE